MKKIVVLSMILGSSLIFNGCTSTSVYEAKYGKEKPIPSFATLSNESARNGIFIWRPDSSAVVSLAVYNKDADGNFVGPRKRQRLVDKTVLEDSVYLHEQKACVMSSATARARDSVGGFKVDVVPPAGNTRVNVGAVAAEMQKNTLLLATSEANTFLDIAFFGICMSSINGSIDNDDAKALMSEAIQSAVSIAKGTSIQTTEEVSSSSASEIESITLGTTVPDVKGLISPAKKN